MADSPASAAAVAGLIEDIMADEEQVVTDISGNGPPVPVEPGDLMGNYRRVQSDPGVATYGPDADIPAPEQPADTPGLPAWSADTSGIEDLLDEPDFDEPAVPTFEAEPVAEETWDDDEEKRRLKAELAKANKRLAWEQEQRTQAQAKAWQAEAARRFPLSDPETITANSRRGFLRAAAEQHARVEKKVKPLTEALEALRTETVQEARQEAREQAREAWGQPRVAPGPQAVVQAEDAQKYDRRNYRSPHDLIRAKLLGGKYGPV